MHIFIIFYTYSRLLIIQTVQRFAQVNQGLETLKQDNSLFNALKEIIDYRFLA